jgi:hypothetical protein
MRLLLNHLLMVDALFVVGAYNQPELSALAVVNFNKHIAELDAMHPDETCDMLLGICDYYRGNNCDMFLSHEGMQTLVTLADARLNVKDDLDPPRRPESALTHGPMTPASQGCLPAKNPAPSLPAEPAP